MWGRNNKGQLGLGDTTKRKIPQKLNLKNISQMIVCGDEYSMALDINGDIWSWGSNDNGQLGLGDTLDRNFPCKVNLSNVSTLAACLHSLAIDNQGQLWSWDLLDLVLVMKLIPIYPKKFVSIMQYLFLVVHTLLLLIRMEKHGYGEGTMWDN